MKKTLKQQIQPLKKEKLNINLRQTEIKKGQLGAIAQEEYEAALASFQTKRKGGMNISLNGVPLTDAEISALDKDEKEKTP
ncbi:MAG TPA: hypothetical protein VKU37_05565 [Verrucomicrobiae bacterium]|nr:hypothetical protein [Verrucomicrobiae bacterium]